MRLLYTTLKKSIHSAYNTVKSSFLLNFDLLFLFVTIVYILLERYYALLAMQTIRLIYLIVMRNPCLKSKLETIQRDQEIIESHWKNDRDLAFLRKLNTSFLGLILILLLISVYFFNVVSKEALTCIDPFEINSSQLKGVYCIIFALALFFFISFSRFFLNMHVIWFRNTPTTAKVIAACLECVKISIGIIPISVILIDVASSTPLVTPSRLLNSYQIYSPAGRGYGFQSSTQMLQDDVLKAYSLYKPKELLGSDKLLCQNKLNAFIYQNKYDILLKLPAQSSVILGIGLNIK
jgi:hypothetical protein